MQRLQSLTSYLPCQTVVLALLVSMLVLAGCGGSAPADAPPAVQEGAAQEASGDQSAMQPATESDQAGGQAEEEAGGQAGGRAEGQSGDQANAAGDAGAEAAMPGDGAAGQPPAPTPGAGDEATDDLPALALAAPSELLDSYRLDATFIITSLLPGGERRIESTQVQGIWRRTDGPFGFDAALTLSNVSGARRQEVVMVAIGADVAILSDGAWSTVARDTALPYGDPDSLLTLPFIARVNRGENLGAESLSGVEVTHYRLDDASLFAEAVEDLKPLADGAVQSVLLEGWVADAGYVVKYLLDASLADVPLADDAGSPVLVQQEVSAGYELSLLDAAPPIEWPPDAQPPGTISVPGFVPNTFPLPQGATATPRLGSLEVRTALPPAEVSTFYRERLSALGWSFEGELGFYSAAKDGQRISLTILPDEANGGTVVRVFGVEG